MRLTWRDAFATLLAALTLGVVLADVAGLALPFISGYRAEVILLGVLGVAAGCGYPAKAWSWRDPLIVAAAVLGVAALVLLVGGLVVASRGWFLALGADLLLLWAVATARHAFLVEGASPRGARGA